MSARVADRISLYAAGFTWLALLAGTPPAEECDAIAEGGSSFGIRKISETRSLNALCDFFSAAAMRAVDAHQR